MKTIITFLLLIIGSNLSAQIIPLEVSEKAKQTPFIIEGKIINEQSYKTNNAIYTNYTLEIYSVLKGNISTNTITINSIGGTVGLERLETCPSNNYMLNENAIFFLKEKEHSNAFEASFFGQSVQPLEKKLSPEEFQKLQKNINLLSQFENLYINQTNSQENRLAPTITSISPTTVNAGVGETITITGSGFGATGPTSGMKVWTRVVSPPNAISSHANTYNYVSWSDTQIVFKVPSKASTGQIWVGSSSNHATSSQTVNIVTSVRDQVTATNSAIYPVHLPKLQNQGIEFVLNTNFTNTDAIDRTKEALEQWQCESSIDFTLDDTTVTTNTNNNSDGLSVIYFDTSLGSSALGVTLTSLAACSATGRWYVSDVDLAINGNTNFNFTLNPTISGEYDYYSVVLHELGHVRNLGHVLNTSQIMYPSLGTGQDKRTLHANDILGGNLVQTDSDTNQVCNQPLMVDTSCPTMSVEEEINYTLKIFPNPTSNYLNISGLKNNTVNYTIFDITGKKLISNTYIQNQKIDVSSLSSGMYILQISNFKAIRFIKK